MILQKAFKLIYKLGWIKTFVRIKLDPVAYARSLGVKVGDDVRLIGIHGGTFGSEPYLIEIGNHVTITSRVQFVTHDGGVWVFRDRNPDMDVFGRISIGNNVFVGFGSIIMPNVRIGNNVVVAAGSIVTKNIPDNSVAVGVPARVIKTLDEYYDSIQHRIIAVKNLPEDIKRSVLESNISELLADRIAN